MAAATKLDDLFRAYEEARARGDTISAEHLCRDCPELLDDLRRRIAERDAAAEIPSTRMLSTAEGAAISTVPAPPPSLPTPQVGAEPVSGYVLRRPLGKGGFGEVWEASAPGGFRVAFKFVPLAGGAAEVERRALEIIRNLRHPNLLTIFGTWQTESWLIIGMELADQTLHDLLQESTHRGRNGLEYRSLLRYSSDTAKVIDYLNKPRHFLGGDRPVGIQHGDIKPQNILLLGEGIKVGDFGLVRLLEKTIAAHAGGMTPHYAAPEVLAGRLSQWSDQYALAVTWCQLRGGRLPFAGSTAEVVEAHRKSAPDLSMLPEVERPVVARALAKQPQQRWPSCRAFIKALAEAAKAAPTPPTRPGARAAPLPPEATPPAPAARASTHAQLLPLLSTEHKMRTNPAARASTHARLLLAGVVLVTLGLVCFLGGFLDPFPQSEEKYAGQAAPTGAKDEELSLVPPAVPGNAWHGRASSEAIVGTTVAEAATGPLNALTFVWQLSARFPDPKAPSLVGGMVAAGSGSPFPLLLLWRVYTGDPPPGGLPALNKLKELESMWGMPEREREALLRELFRGMSPRDRRAIREYFRTLARKTDGRKTDKPPGPPRPPSPPSSDVPTASPVEEATQNTWSTVFAGGAVLLLILLALSHRSVLRRRPARQQKRPLPRDRGAGPAPAALATLTLAASAEAHTEAVWTVALPSGGGLAVSGGLDGAVVLWEVEVGLNPRRLGTHGGAVTAVAFAPDGHCVLTASLDETLRLWDAGTGQERHRLAAGGRLLSAALSPDGRTVVAGGEDGPLRVWDIGTGREVLRCVGHAGAVASIAFSPDGRLLLSGSDDHTARLWDVASGRELHRLEGHTAPIRVVAFSPNGNVAVTAGEDGLLRLWDVRSGQEGGQLAGHTDWVRAVAFLPDGRRLLSSGDDETLCLWDVATRQLLGRFPTPFGSVLGLACFPDGRRILTGSDDRSVRVWRFAD